MARRAVGRIGRLRHRTVLRERVPAGATAELIHGHEPTLRRHGGRELLCADALRRPQVSTLPGPPGRQMLLVGVCVRSHPDATDQVHVDRPGIDPASNGTQVGSKSLPPGSDAPPVAGACDGEHGVTQSDRGSWQLPIR